MAFPGSIFFFHTDSTDRFALQEIVQAQEGGDDVRVTNQRHLERPPSNPPRGHEDIKRPFDLHSQLAEVEVEGVFTRRQVSPRLRRQQLFADRVCPVADYVVAWR